MKTQINRINKNSIAIRYCSSVILPEVGLSRNDNLIVMVQAELMRLGYILDSESRAHLATLSKEEINDVFREVIPIIWNEKGADKSWRMFYPNFPKQVMRASEVELFMNAILHYSTCGHWLPCYKANGRLPVIEESKFISLKLGSEEGLLRVFTQILGSNASISDSDKEALAWFVREYRNDLAKFMPEDVPFKENLCFFAALHLNHQLEFEVKAFSSATDVLRLMSGLSDGDVSLADNTKFRSWKRSERRYLIQTLENIVRKDDLARHGEKWKRAFHGLHIGDYAKSAPKSFALADQLRNGKIRTHLSLVEAAITERDADKIFKLLGNKPGELARRLDHLMRILKVNEVEPLLDLFENVAARIDARVLVQLYGHFKQRNDEVRERIVMPKGSMAKARLLKTRLPVLLDHHVAKIISIIWFALGEKFSGREAMGKVWIDPLLKLCPIALSQRSASESLRTVARGTRLPLGDKQTLRMFIWWVGQDVDLSCVLYDEKFKKSGHVSYTNLRLKKINACHSGDIVSAPNGAAEFIDINMDQAVKSGVRYIAMNVLDFTGMTFAKYEECFAGWMTRDFPNENEAYDARTVEQKVDLRSATTFAMPAVFDLKKREAIWVDLAANVASGGSNNVESRSATIVDLMKGAIALKGKMNLYELFMINAQSRGEIVYEKEEADIVFSMSSESGGITPFDISKINSEYL